MSRNVIVAGYRAGFTGHRDISGSETNETLSQDQDKFPLTIVGFLSTRVLVSCRSQVIINKGVYQDSINQGEISASNILTVHINEYL